MYVGERREAMYSDDEIIEKVLKGNKNIFSELVNRYQKLVFAICFNSVKDAQEAENLAQETFLQAFRSLSSYNNNGFKNWLGRIAVNKSIDFKRKNKAEVIYIEDIVDFDVADSESIDMDFLKREDEKRIVSLCNELPQKYCTILKKYYIHSKSYNEIALEEGISTKTVESRLYRGRKLLRQKWEEENDHETL